MEAKIDEYSDWIPETEPETLKNKFNSMLKSAGFGIISFTEHHFKPEGYTCLWLISESHFAVHTFPEECKTYIHLSSCNRKMYYDFLNLLTEYKNEIS